MKMIFKVTGVCLFDKRPWSTDDKSLSRGNKKFERNQSVNDCDVVRRSKMRSNI